MKPTLCELVLLNPKTAGSEIITALFIPFVFSCSYFIINKVSSLFLQTLHSPDLSPLWQMETEQIYAPRDNIF